jgi:hypothetical protein
MDTLHGIESNCVAKRHAFLMMGRLMFLYLIAGKKRGLEGFKILTGLLQFQSKLSPRSLNSDLDVLLMVMSFSELRPTVSPLSTLFHSYCMNVLLETSLKVRS